MANDDYDFEGASEGGQPRCTPGTYLCRIESVQMGPSTREDLDPRTLYTINFVVLKVIAGGLAVVVNQGELEENPPPGPVVEGQSRAVRFKIDGKKGERDRARVLHFIQAVCGFGSVAEAAEAKGDDGKSVDWNTEIKDAAKAANPLEGQDFVMSLSRQIAVKSKRAFYVPMFQPAPKAA